MPHLAVFSTNGSGLNAWQDVGSLSREVAIYKVLSKHGWDVSFYTYDRTRHLPRLGFDAKVYSQRPYLFPRSMDFIYQGLVGVLRYFSGCKTSVVVTNQAHGGWPAVIAARLWGAKVIARCGMVHGECSEVTGKAGKRARKKADAERWTFRHSDMCFIPTKELADWVQLNYGIDREKICVIPNYVDTDVFRPIDTVQKKYDIVCVGRLVDKKRYELLIEALSGSGLKVHIIGSGKNRDKLLELAKERSVNLDITLRVEHDELAECYNQADIYVNVAMWEGHPKALIEAMACGCACIGTDSPGVKNQIVDGVNGLLSGSEPEAIGAAVDRLVSDRPLRERLGRNAREYSVQNFSLDNVFQKYEEALERVLA